jgi:hypothetical protein
MWIVWSVLARTFRSREVGSRRTRHRGDISRRVLSRCIAVGYIKTPNQQCVQSHQKSSPVDCVWNVMAHAQKPDFVFRRNGRVHLNRLGCQFSRLLATEVCASSVVMLDTPSSEVVWRVLATHSIRQFPLYFPSRASSCAITFQQDYTTSLSGIFLELRWQFGTHFCVTGRHIKTRLLFYHG